MGFSFLGTPSSEFHCENILHTRWASWCSRCPQHTPIDCYIASTLLNLAISLTFPCLNFDTEMNCPLIACRVSCSGVQHMTTHNASSYCTTTTTTTTTVPESMMVIV
eukprot:2672369-Amphidinium_carterae.1